jgi:hypothetical protein
MIVTDRSTDAKPIWAQKSRGAEKREGKAGRSVYPRKAGGAGWPGAYRLSGELPLERQFFRSLWGGYNIQLS